MSTSSEYYSSPDTPPDATTVATKAPPHAFEPPPYTPYCEASVSLLSNQRNRPQSHQESVQSPTTPPAIVRPRGYRRLTQYFTPKNLLITGVTLLVLALLSGVFTYLYIRGHLWYSERNVNFVLERHDSFHIHNSNLSYDKHYNTVIMSQFEVPAQRLVTFLLFLDTNEFRVLRTPIPTHGFDDCMRFADSTYCCTTSVHSRNYQTKCWHQSKHHEIGGFPNGTEYDHFVKQSKNGTKESLVSHYHYSKHWQHFYDGSEAIVLENAVNNVILDINENKHYELPEKEKKSYKSAGFYFPMDDIGELNELIKTKDHFKVCEYKLDERLKKYYNKHEKCAKMPIVIDPRLGKTLFCSIPTYNGVLQYGHIDGKLELNLKVNFTSSTTVQVAKTSVNTTFESVVMDCNEENVDLYVLGEKSVYKATVALFD
uniref:DUF4793 domain-containing protein n=1 Tax=Panagrellus redivivus TaxID=6233 RepID=A0A7E4WA95_PANRE